MGVRFIIGRAGSGKTHHCVTAIQKRLCDDPIDGPRLILLVPEQASLQMERAVLQRADAAKPTETKAVTHRAEVLSFQRLAFRVLQHAAPISRQVLSEAARIMVLRHILAQKASELTYYRHPGGPGPSGGRMGGVADRLATTIAELLEEGVASNDLDLSRACDALDKSGVVSADPAHAAKIRDIRLVHTAYLDFLGTDRRDPSQYLLAAREHLTASGWLQGAHLWVDGFASFSGQERLTLTALAGLCSEVRVTVLADPAVCMVSAGQSTNELVYPRRQLFARTVRTYQQLHDQFLEAGLQVEEPIVLDSRPLPRFGACPLLADVERSFPGALPERTGASALQPEVEVVGLPNHRLEVDYAVSRVCQWVQEFPERNRYRDIAIIVRDLEPYHDLLSEALAARNVPYFIDRRRPIAHHPLIELLRAGLDMAAESMSLESVRLALKTGLISLDMETVDELENYLLAHGIEGIDVWRRAHWTFPAVRGHSRAQDRLVAEESASLGRINAARRRFMTAMDDWLTFAAGGVAHSGAAWFSALHRWFDAVGVSHSLRRWTATAESAGDLDAAEEHRQVWREVAALLDDMAFAFAETPLDAHDLVDVLGAALSSLTLGLIPPMVDQVLVGAIERSRHPDLKAAVVLGFNEGIFPKALSEDSVLNDDDRVILQAAGVPIRPSRRERVFDEALLAYVALTRASEVLVITYATSDGDGKSLRPSPFVESLLAGRGGLRRTGLGDPARTRAFWDILAPNDLVRRLAAEFRTRPEPGEDQPAVRGRWNELYEASRSDLAADPRARRALAAFQDERGGRRLSPSAVKRVHGVPLKTSVSALESYATCPFQHFARYILRLEERREATLKPVDVGQIHHAILEDFVKTIADRGLHLGRLTDSQVLDLIGRSGSRVVAKLPESALASAARDAYQGRRAAGELARIMRAQRNRAQKGRDQPRAAELPFGWDQAHSLPAMELTTPKGRRAVLRGYIDRVDLAELGDELLGIVIDYKRTKDKRLDFSASYHGISLQLLAYLLVLAETGRSLTGRRIRPIAGFYVGLIPQYNRVAHPSLVSPRDAELSGAARPRGLVVEDAFDALESSFDSGWSQHFNVYRTKAGSFGHKDRSDVVSKRSFDALLRHIRTTMGQLADGILDGDVSVRPYRMGSLSPCSWCPMSSVCRFEMGISDVRFLDSLKKPEVLQKLSEELS